MPAPDFAFMWVDSRDHTGTWVNYSKFVNCETNEILGDVTWTTLQTAARRWVGATYRGETRYFFTMLAAQRWVERQTVMRQDSRIIGP